MSGSSEQISPKFISLKDGEDVTRCFKFRLVSYNILAQVYVKSSYFPNSPSSCLKWKARSQAILTALKGFNADFLCIQELDEYDSFYKSNLESTGYSGIYIQRNGQKRDGCGIFYKLDCAKLVSVEDIYYNDLADSLNSESTEIVEREFSDKANQSDHGDLDDPRVRLKRDCVGLLAAFKLNDPSHLVIVANTHIYWDPELIDVKLAQVKYLLLRVAPPQSLLLVILTQPLGMRFTSTFYQHPLFSCTVSMGAMGESLHLQTALLASQGHWTTYSYQIPTP